ncbi:hypothetical protein CACET_c21270 [Clostridium aceticum]|uniref:Uncharacterized protein n=2 Tax=Clostridium aceticum TaxID=84022 RepID=A0A0G3WDS7_9CLOT|nr:hypothetical protein [Clostridium aceticum]AKL95574.1 hypothetical protein CACET_c21270 [Clostridium aceticum]
MENGNPEYSYVYSNLCGILIVTAIKKTSYDLWHNTLVTDGTITTDQLMGSPVLGELIMILKECSTGIIPEKQLAKILSQFIENEDKVLNSKFFEEFSKDVELNELYKKIIKDQ